MNNAQTALAITFKAD